MELKIGMSGEELRHGLGLVRRKVVRDEVDLLALGLRGEDICEKGNELRTGVARVVLPRTCPLETSRAA